MARTTSKKQQNSESASDLTVLFKETTAEKHCQRKKSKKKSRTYQHFSVVCDTTLVEKIKAISNKEGIPIRYIVEQMFKQGIIAYEAKHGEAKPVKRSAEDLFL